MSADAAEAQGADLAALGKHAARLEQAGKWREAARLFAPAHAAEPFEVRWQAGLLRAFGAMGEPVAALFALEAGSVPIANWIALEGALAGALRALAEEPPDRAAAAAFHAVSRIAGDAGAAIAMLIALPKATLWRMSEAIAAGSIAADLATMVALTDRLAIVGEADAAAAIFGAFAEAAEGDAHLALLGARIALQRGETAAAARHLARCERARTADPSLDLSPLYHAAALLTATDEADRTARAAAMAAALGGAGVDPEIVFHFLATCPGAERLAASLGALGAGSPATKLTRLAGAFAAVWRGDPPSEDAIALIASGALAYPRVLGCLIDSGLDPARSLAANEALLDRLDLSNAAIKNHLAKRAAALQAGGAFELARAIGARLSRVWPKEHWVRIHAMENAHRAGRLEEARALADGFPIAEIDGEMLADVAQAHAKVGLTQRAAALYGQADETLATAALSTRVALVLARGLLLVGAPERAFAWYDRVHPATDGASEGDAPVILDPGYGEGAGHHTNYTRHLAAHLSRLAGRPCEIHVGRGAETAALKASPVRHSFAFETYVYNAFQTSPQTLQRLNEGFCADLNLVFGARRPPAIAMHSVRFNMIEGLIGWLLATPRERRTIVVLGLIEADQLYTDAVEALRQRLAEKADALFARSDLALLIYAETDAAVRWLAGAFPRLTPQKLPYLAAARLASAPPERRAKPTFGMLGATRRERGFSSLLRAIARVPAAACDFLVQLDEAVAADFGDGTLAALEKIRDAPNLTCLDGVLAPETYDQNFLRLDGLVLPYAGRYAVSGSGVFFEAICARRFVIVPRGSSLAQELAALCYPHALIDPDDPGDIARAIVETAARWPQVQAALARFDSRGVMLPHERFAGLLERLWRDAHGGAAAS